MPRASRDFATVLTHPSLPMAKTWRRDGTIAPYSTAKYFQSRFVPLDNFRELCDLLHVLGSSPRSCVIRGKYKGDAYSKAHNPDHKEGLAQRTDDLHDDLPHHWVLVEVDEFVPIGADPVTDPVGAIEEYLAEHLPAFTHSSYYWQLSNSAGHEKHAGKLKAHIWFWMQNACSSSQLREWAKATKQALDYAVFQPVQVHYTSKPIFERGMKDPVPVRAGRVDKDSDEVSLTIEEHYEVGAKVSRREVIDATYQADPVAQRLFERNMVKKLGKAGELFIDCPCEDRHTGESGETTTVYYPANTGGYANGNFKCLHAHCIDAPQFEFTQALGFTPIDDFDIIEDDDPIGSGGTATSAEAVAKAGRFTPIHASEFAVDTPTPWIVKGVIPASRLVVIYGAPATGKSFVALDMVGAVASGAADWRGHRIPKQGRVAYICAEGAGGFRKRLSAYAQHHGIPLGDIDLFVIPAAPNLLKGDDVKELIRALHPFGPFICVVVDTLAQVTAGGNENSSEDMGLAINQAGVIADVLKTTVVLIHHSGKDDSKGARGHSSLKGAADTELEVLRDGDHRVLHLAKQKDGEDGLDFGFRLEIVTLGQDEDGDPITSCAVDMTTSTKSEIRKARKKGGNENHLVDVFVSICTNPDQGVTQNELIEAAIAAKGEPDDSKARNTLKTNFMRALKTLVRDEIFISTDGVITMESDIS